MNDALPPDVTEFLANPIVISFAIGLMVMWFLINGLSMKWALGLVKKQRVGFFWSCFVVSVMTAITGLVQFGVTVTFAPDAWVTMLYTFGAAVLTIAVLAPCDPIRALLASLCYGTFATIGSAAVAIGIALLVTFSIQEGAFQITEDMQRLADKYKHANSGALSTLRQSLEKAGNQLDQSDAMATPVKAGEIQDLLYQPTGVDAVSTQTASPGEAENRSSSFAPTPTMPAQGRTSGEPPMMAPELLFPEGVQTNPFAQ